ncbi:MAG: hypothetical protein AB1758_33860 [Candidatus Eremiobacterota bacterium]
METRNFLIFVHGIMLEEHPPLGRVQYRTLWEAVTASHPGLLDRFRDDDRVEVEWGKFVRDTIEPDQWINLAQEHLARMLDPDEVRKSPGPNNLILPPRPGSLPNLPWDSLAGPLRQVLFVRGLGDVFYYCGTDGQIAVQLSVFGQILQAMEIYRHKPDVKLRLFVVAHSVGVAIAYDFLTGLFGHLGERHNGQEPPVPPFVSSPLLAKKREIPVERFEYWRQNAVDRLELGGVASLGSSLPLLMLRNQQVVDTLATGRHLQADEIGIAPDTIEIVWKNFYDASDIMALPIRPAYGNPAALQDVQVRSGDDPWATGAYWGCPDVQSHVAELLTRRSAAPVEVELQLF